MNSQKRRYTMRIVALLLAMPFVVFAALLTLLYLPPVQHWAVDKAAQVASESTGMDIRVGRIRLAFPLDLALEDVVARDSLRTDTLASVGELRTGVAFWPLLRGEVRVGSVSLTRLQAQTGNLIPSVEIDGRIGQLRLRDGDVNLADETVEVEGLMMEDADVSVTLRPVDAAVDTVSAPVRWKILLDRAEMRQVDFRLQVPADTLHLLAGWKQMELEKLDVDLEASAYGAGHLELVGGSVTYDSSAQPPAQGLDYNHLAVSDMEIGLDSVYYKGKEVRGIIRQLALRERSGFRLVHTEGRVRMDSLGINMPHLLVELPSSRMYAVGKLPWGALEQGGDGSVNASIEGNVMLADVAALAGEAFPDTVVQSLSVSPLKFSMALRGNMNLWQLDTLDVRMDHVAELGASGEIYHLVDSLRRTGELEWHTVAHDLDVLTWWLMGDSASLQIPREMRMGGVFGVDKMRYRATFGLQEQDGWLAASGYFDTGSEEYALNLRADSLALHHFLPKDSLGHFTAHAKAVGRGMDFYAGTSRLLADMGVDSLQYGKQLVTDVNLKAALKEHRVHVALDSHNAVLDMTARADGLLYRDSLKAKAVVDIAEADLYALQVADEPLAASVWVEMKPDTLYAQAKTGDFDLQINCGEGLASLVEHVNAFVRTLQAQLEQSAVDLEEAKALLPDARVMLKAGAENPVVDYLHDVNGLRFEQADVEICVSPSSGMSVDGHVYSLRADSLEFDTVKVGLVTTASLNADLVVSNAPNQRKPAFTARLKGELGNRASSALISFHNGKRELGLELGARAALEEGGMRLSFFPEHPTLGFRTFTLNDSNYIALGDSGRITADVTLLDKAGTGLRLYSSPNEEALQDLTADITRLNLAEILKVLPYAPEIAGLLDVELHYVQKDADNTFSGTMQVEGLAYEGYPMGTLGMEAVYLPESGNNHLVSLQLLRNGHEIAAVDGSYGIPSSVNGGEADGVLDALLNLERFPLDMANAFVPRDLVEMSGLLGGELAVQGALSAPRINGEVHFDSVQLHSPLYAVDLHVDKTPLRITDNRMLFDGFHIYAKGKNPFTLAGHVDLGDFSHMRADLQMRAEDYELLNAKKNRTSVVYGKVFVSLFSTIKGELSSPLVRGTMQVLGNTDVVYVMKESPLTVEDRLGNMVTFVDFNDTLASVKPHAEVTLGGMDILMNVQIDQGAQVQVDLGGDNYVKVQGGGDLSMQYTPQGDLLLTGRYTLNNGEMKYSLPVIPLKTFNIASGSYVEFTGNPSNPNLNITATERVRTSVTEDNSSRYINFDVGVSITNSLDNMGMAFTLDAPEDVSLQNQLAAMSAEERGKLAVTMLVTGMYAGGQGGTSGGFNTGNALNSFLQSEISNIAGNALKTVDVSIGVEDKYAADGTSQGGTDYSFRFAKRFWNNRLSVIIGGRISTGNETMAEEDNSFIDDISLEWRLDDSGTRYVKLFHTKNYESILEGEIIETGVGLVLRRKVNKLGELFIFRRKE